MADAGISLVDLKGISEPITKLIESVSKGIGAIYAPVAKVRDAKAEAKSMVIMAEAKNLVSEISSRAYERVSFRELRRQNNIDAIVSRAALELPDEVSDQEVNEDWIVNFFGLSQDVGDAEMQQVWAKILAGEVAKPGTFKPRTLMAVKSLTADEAKMFTLMCSFSFEINAGEWVLPNFSYEYFAFLRESGLTVDVDLHLKNIGLLSGSEIYYGSGVVAGEDESEEDFDLVEVSYFSESYFAIVERGEDGIAMLEAFPFTEIGNELAAIAGAKPNPDYVALLLENGDVISGVDDEE